MDYFGLHQLINLAAMSAQTAQSHHTVWQTK